MFPSMLGICRGYSPCGFCVRSHTTASRSPVSQLMLYASAISSHSRSVTYASSRRKSGRAAAASAATKTTARSGAARRNIGGLGEFGGLM